MSEGENGQALAPSGDLTMREMARLQPQTRTTDLRRKNDLWLAEEYGRFRDLVRDAKLDLALGYKLILFATPDGLVEARSREEFTRLKEAGHRLVEGYAIRPNLAALNSVETRFAGAPADADRVKTENGVDGEGHKVTIIYENDWRE